MRAAQNPFRTDCVTNLPFQLQQTNWDELWARLERQNGRGAIVGHCGSGKTTLLGEVGEALSERGLEVVRLNFSQRHRKLDAHFQPRALGSHQALLVDGVEQLSRYDVWRLSRASPRFFIITSHRKSFLPTWLETSTSPLLLAQLCGQLGIDLDESELQTLWQAKRGDLREAFWQLYDQYSLKKVA